MENSFIIVSFALLKCLLRAESLSGEGESEPDICCPRATLDEMTLEELQWFVGLRSQGRISVIGSNDEGYPDLLEEAKGMKARCGLSIHEGLGLLYALKENRTLITNDRHLQEVAVEMGVKVTDSEPFIPDLPVKKEAEQTRPIILVQFPHIFGKDESTATGLGDN